MSCLLAKAVASSHISDQITFCSSALLTYCQVMVSGEDGAIERCCERSRLSILVCDAATE